MHEYRSGVDVKRLDKTINVLLVDDNSTDTQLFKDTLKNRIGKDLFVYDACSIKEANEILTNSEIDIIFLDLNLPGSADREGFKKLKENSGDIPVIILSDSKEEEFARRLVRMGARNCILKKGYTESQIMRLLLFAMSEKELLSEMRNIRQNFIHLIDNIEPTVFVINSDRKILYVDHSVKELLGQSDTELIGQEFLLEFNLDKKIVTSLDEYDAPGKIVQINAHKSVWENNEAVVLTVEDITAKQISDEKLKRLESIRIASRDINRLIVRSEESEELIFSTLRVLYESRLFDSVQIYLTGEEVTGPGKVFTVSDGGDVKKQSGQSAGEFSSYFPGNAGLDKLLELAENSSDPDEITYIKALCCNNESFGYMSAILRKEGFAEKEVKELLVEIADDLAFTFKNFNVRRELQKSTRKLKLSEEKFQKFFHEHSSGNFIADENGKLIECNRTYLNIFGFSSFDEAQSFPIEKLYVNESDRKSLIKLISLQKKVPEYHVKMRRVNGDILNIEATVSGVYDEKGSLRNIIGHIVDVTEKNKALEALVNSENKFRELSDNLPITIAIIKGYKLLYANKEASRLTGYKLNELYSTDILSFLNPEEADKIREMFRSDVKQDKTAKGFEVEIKTKSNINKWVDITAVEIYYEGETAILITALDVSARKRAEDEIRKLSQAVHQSPIGVIITDEKGAIEYVNSYFTVITGYSAIDVLGKNPRILQSGSTDKSVYKNMWKTLSSGKTWNGEFINKDKNGREYIIKSTISPIKDRRGRITHYVALEEDISELKKMIQDLVEAREEAEKADRLKSEFIAQISHEIRTPITPIMSYTGFLRDKFSDGADETMNMIFNSIERSSKRLIRTVDLLIHISELSVGTYDKNRNKTNIRKDIFEPCYYEYCTLAKRKNLNFRFELDEEIEIITNTSALYEILMNLLDNAVKYTEKGSILLTGIKDRNKFIIKVSDTGIGIAEEYLPKIFELFSQEDAGYTRRFDGTGLGMALVKKYCDLNEIELSVESTKGKGTTFALKFDISEEL